MSLLSWRASIVLLLSLSAVACKNRKVHYDDTQYEDTLEVVYKHHQPGYYTYYFVDEVLYPMYHSPEYRTEFRGEQIHRFTTSSEGIYENFVLRDSVQARFRKEHNGGGRCKLDELFAPTGRTFSNVSGTCRLLEEARGVVPAGAVDEFDHAGDESMEEYELSPETTADEITADDIEDFLLVLPEIMDHLALVPTDQVDEALALLDAYLAGSPNIAVDTMERVAAVVTESLDRGARVPSEYVNRFNSVVMAHLERLPYVSPPLLEALSDLSRRAAPPLALYPEPVTRLHRVIRSPYQQFRVAPEVVQFRSSTALPLPAAGDRLSPHSAAARE